MVLRLDIITTASVPNVAIYSNNAAGNPSTLLQTLRNPAINTGTTNFTFSSPANLTLAASTTYWVVVTNAATVSNSFFWEANTPAITPTGVATSAGYRDSFGAPPPTGPSTTFNAYAVNANVPEPASWAVLSVGVAALGVVTLRQRRTARA